MTHVHWAVAHSPGVNSQGCGPTEDSGCRWGRRAPLKVSRELSHGVPTGIDPRGKVTWENSIPLADHGRLHPDVVGQTSGKIAHYDQNRRSVQA